MPVDMVNSVRTKLYDFTTLNTFQTCEQEAYYRYGQHLASPVVSASALFGTAVHAGVRALFAGEPAVGQEEEKGACWYVSEAWGVGHEDEKKKYLTLAYAQECVKMYVEAHKSRQFDTVLNETYLEWPERRLCGIVDRVVRSKADGQLYVMDLKTTGLYLSQAWFEQWRHSLQAAIYLELAERELEQQVAGFWVDAIHVDRRGAPKPEDFMRVGPFPYSESLRSELRAVVRELVREADATLETGVATKNTHSCFRFQSLCSFYRYCTTDREDRADVIKMALASGDLVEAEWVPKLRGA